MSKADAMLTAVERGPVPAALKRFIWDIQSMVELADSEREILVIGRDLMARLVASDDWLPAVFARVDPGGGAQFHLYSDALERFSVVGTVLSAGSGLLIEQSSLWEIAGGLRGTVSRQPCDSCADAGVRATTQARVLQPGEVEARSSRSAQIMALSNAAEDRASISIHVYGGDLGKLRRLAWTGDASAEGQSLGYANGQGAPPYDILSIQTEVLD